jgi:N-acetylglucosaminyldiphosphoundecaprenol N-acetyl-beta-D-mannosaminyltransferase
MIVFNKLLSRKEEVLEKIFGFTEQNTSLLITYFNQHCFNTYFKNDHYRKLIEENFIIYSDGAGIYFSLKFLFKKEVKRTDATNINYSVIDELIKNKEPIFIVGGRYDEAFLHKILTEKGINLAGYGHGFPSSKERIDLVEKICKHEARFVLVGMGVPKQEYFAHEISESSFNKIIICVGNFLEFYLGTVKRAPVIFQKLGLEWFFRILTEPKRLWRRYIFGIPEFIYRVIKLKSEEK